MTSVNSLNTARESGAGFGTQSLAVYAGGYGPVQSSATELWNGTSWRTNPNSLVTARQDVSGIGTQTSGLAFGGYTTTPVATTELW